jgi:hypothetical protein
VLSDPVDLNVPALSDLAISLYLPGTVQATTIHNRLLQTNYVSLPGNFTAPPRCRTSARSLSWPFLTEVDVDAAGAAPSWPWATRSPTAPAARHRHQQPLARLAGAAPADRARSPRHQRPPRRGQPRHQRQPPAARRAEPAGRAAAALERFDRDVLATAGVRYMIGDDRHQRHRQQPGTNPIPAAT